MSERIAFIVEALLRLGMRVLQTLDAARAASFRAAVRDDACGVLLGQLGGDNAHNPSGVAQPATGEPERGSGHMDG